MKLISLYTLLGPATILLLTALAVVTDWGTAGLITNSGPHGLSEIVFAYTSSLANNGQNFAGLNANTPFYNLTTAFAMMAGRFGLALLALALAGHLAPQPRRPGGSGPCQRIRCSLRAGDRDDLHCGRPELLPSPRPGASGRASAARAVSRSTTGGGMPVPAPIGHMMVTRLFAWLGSLALSALDWCWRCMSSYCWRSAMVTASAPRNGRA